MKRIIRPHKLAYAGLGGWTFLALLAMALTLSRQENKGTSLILMLIVSLAYGLWGWILSGHALIVSDEGLTLRRRLVSDTTIAWPDIERSALPYLMGRPPLQILVWKRVSSSPALKIPLKLYAKEDVQFLLNWEGLRLKPASLPVSKSPGAPLADESWPKSA